MVGEEEKREWDLSSVDQEEWAEVLAELVDGRNGITVAELLALAPQLADDNDLLSTLLQQLDQLGVELLDPEDQAASGAQSAGSATPDWNAVHEDLLDLYLAELSREPLLSREQELELARQVDLGRQAEQALRETDYNADEYARLEALVQAGQAAREHMGRANTRLVVSIAKRYRGYGIPFPDLIQNGNVGLMRAVDHYDHRTGYRFSTYATWWIRQAVTRSLSNHGRVIRIPVHTGTRIRKMQQVAQRLEQERGARPTLEDIADEMEESPAKISQMIGWAKDTISLEQPVGKERDVELRDFIEDTDVLAPEEVTDTVLLHETLSYLFRYLTPREVQILRLHFGLGGAPTHTLSQIGQKLGLSRERIRQIERQALAKLRLIAPDHRLEQFL